MRLCQRFAPSTVPNEVTGATDADAIAIHTCINVVVLQIQVTGFESIAWSQAAEKIRRSAGD